MNSAPPARSSDISGLHRNTVGHRVAGCERRRRRLRQLATQAKREGGGPPTPPDVRSTLELARTERASAASDPSEGETHASIPIIFFIQRKPPMARPVAATNIIFPMLSWKSVSM